MIVRSLAVVLVVLATALAQPVSALLPSALAPTVQPAVVTSGPAGYDPNAGPGSHIVAHFKGGNAFEEFLEVRNADGELALRLRVVFSKLQAFDGAAWRNVANISGNGWNRLDIVLEGDTAMVVTNHLLSARVPTLGHADEGSATFLTTTTVQVGPIRHDGARAVAMDAFTTTSHDGGWVGVGDTARLVVRSQSSTGYRSVSHLRVAADPVPSAAFLAVPVGSLNGTYVAEIAATPEGLITPSEGMVVLAGLSGPLDAPVVEWSVRIARVPRLGEAQTEEGLINEAFSIAFVYQGSDGASAVVSKGWFSAGEFHHVRAVVDEPAGRIAFVADGAETATIIALPSGAGASEWVAAGDLGLCLCDDSRLSGVFYDDLAVIDLR